MTYSHASDDLQAGQRSLPGQNLERSLVVREQIVRLGHGSSGRLRGGRQGRHPSPAGDDHYPIITNYDDLGSAAARAVLWPAGRGG
jgi:hypothetical protein